MGHINPQVGARLPPADVKKIESLVEAGRFNSASDFVRRAVAEKLEKVEAAKA